MWWTCLSRFWELVMDREAWLAAVHRVSGSRAWLSDWTDFAFNIGSDAKQVTNTCFSSVLTWCLSNITCKDLLVLLWESVGQGASIIIIFAVFIYLFIHSFNNPNPSNDQGWAKSSEDPEIWGWGLPAWLKGRNPPASKGSLACKDWRMTHSSGLLPGRHGNPVRPDLLIFKENLKT